MTYAYGTKGVPAVGGGLPGLPRRQRPQPVVPDSDILNWSKYQLLNMSWRPLSSGTQLTYLTKFYSDGRVLQELTFASPKTIYTSMSEDKSLLFLWGSSVSGGPNGRLIDVKKMNVLSSVYNVQVGGRGGRGVAIHKEKDLLALPLTGNRMVGIYKLSDFLNHDGGDFSSLPLVDSFQTPGGGTDLSNQITALDWAPQGDLLLVTAGASTISSVALIEYPSKIVKANFGLSQLPSDALDTGRRVQSFSYDGKVFSCPYTSGTGSSGAGYQIRTLERTSSGEFAGSNILHSAIRSGTTWGVAVGHVNENFYFILNEYYSSAEVPRRDCWRLDSDATFTVKSNFITGSYLSATPLAAADTSPDGRVAAYSPSRNTVLFEVEPESSVSSENFSNTFNFREIPFPAGHNVSIVYVLQEIGHD